MGIIGELPVERHELPDLLGQSAPLLPFLNIDLFDLPLELGQLDLQRFEQLAEVGLVLLGKPL